MAALHLAQLNVARAKAPLDSAELAEFMALLDPVNELADGAPGFVWRLEGEGGDATSIRAYDDDRIIVNMSVWESIDALWDFVYAGGHLDVMRRRREAHLVLWWVPAGHLPTVDEAIERLDLLEARGPSPEAFTFKVRFDPETAVPFVDERDGCPA
jgi:hypothetical protein